MIHSDTMYRAWFEELQSDTPFIATALSDLFALMHESHLTAALARSRSELISQSVNLQDVADDKDGMAQRLPSARRWTVARTLLFIQKELASLSSSTDSKRRASTGGLWRHELSQSAETRIHYLWDLAAQLFAHFFDAAYMLVEASILPPRAHATAKCVPWCTVSKSPMTHRPAGGDPHGDPSPPPSDTIIAAHATSKPAGLIELPPSKLLGSKPLCISSEVREAVSARHCRGAIEPRETDEHTQPCALHSLGSIIQQLVLTNMCLMRVCTTLDCCIQPTEQPR